MEPALCHALFTQRCRSYVVAVEDALQLAVKDVSPTFDDARPVGVAGAAEQPAVRLTVIQPL